MKLTIKTLDGEINLSSNTKLLSTSMAEDRYYRNITYYYVNVLLCDKSTFPHQYPVDEKEYKRLTDLIK